MEKTSKNTYFDVAAAGRIQISNTPTWETTGKVGFHFGVEWGEHGFAGGVLSVDEAEKLAQHIIKSLRKHKLEKINP